MSDFRVGVHKKIEKTEKLAEIAIQKAKDLLLEMSENNSVVELEDETEEVKVKRPPKSGKKEKLSMPTDSNDAFAGEESEG
tara:strand:- start:99 stop:341 length:243 start_codon:yes stop_codon:yes gene_type:complete